MSGQYNVIIVNSAIGVSCKAMCMHDVIGSWHTLIRLQLQCWMLRINDCYILL